MKKLALITFVTFFATIAAQKPVAKKVSVTTSKPVQSTKLSAQDVVKMVQAGLPDDIIVREAAKKGIAEIGVEELITLKGAKASDALLKFLQDPSKPYEALPPPAPPAPVQVQKEVPTPAEPPVTEVKETKPSRPETVFRPSVPESNPATEDEFKEALKSRYDGKILGTVMGGLYAGEYKKGFIGGKGDASLFIYHYGEGMEVKNRQRSSPFQVFGKRTDDMESIDERTFISLEKGLNVTQLAKGESLKVSKFYVQSDGIEFNLVTTGLSHVKDLDMHKASTQTTTRVSGNRVQRNTVVAGFGLRFKFFFDKDHVMKENDLKTVISEINKYLLPREEADRMVEAESNVEINIGLSEEDVLARLGKPIRTLKVGDQKSLVYKDLTIVLRDGRVAEVK